MRGRERQSLGERQREYESERQRVRRDQGFIVVAGSGSRTLRAKSVEFDPRSTLKWLLWAVALTTKTSPRTRTASARRRDRQGRSDFKFGRSDFKVWQNCPRSCSGSACRRPDRKAGRGRPGTRLRPDRRRSQPRALAAASSSRGQPDITRIVGDGQLRICNVRASGLRSPADQAL